MVLLTKPEDTGRTMGGFYYKDPDHGRDTFVYCQLTGRACFDLSEVSNESTGPDCTRCNIPLIFAILKASSVEEA